LKHTKDFFDEISRKTSEVNKGEATKNLASVLNNNFDATEQFHQVYRDLIIENMMSLRKNYATVKLM
jgi:hypothetical protein